MLYDLKGYRRATRSQQLRELDELIVVLECYILSTIPSQQGKGEGQRWNLHSDKCLPVLEEPKEYPSEVLLTQLVKLRQLAGTAIEYLTSTHIQKPQFALAAL
ncbi:hypothetical protein BJX63DRAFT_432851 [Aspergillus granulosus]|uniref:Uncharacterized protein n=1 Tax=Aspergillus granulosus TaxID=176169 RepID=A0ABR4H9S5_9EURO